MDVIRTIKVLGRWSLNRMQGKRMPLIAVFSMTHYCNYYCAMCPFGDPDKDAQMRLAMHRDLSTEQWKAIMSKVAPHVIWSIVEGGEPTSRKDILELLEHLKSLSLPVTMITNGSLLHTLDLDRLKQCVDYICLSIDSLKQDSYCKVRGVKPELFNRVMSNIMLLKDHGIKHYINSVITKWNTEEFITHEYFDTARSLGIRTVSMTFVEDRSDVNYSLLPDRHTMVKVCNSILDYMKRHDEPFILIPPLYWEQIIAYGRVLFDECGVWKSIFVNADGSVMAPCWKYKDNVYNLLEHDVDYIWRRKEWDEVKHCKECDVLACIWYSSQSPSVIANGYMRGIRMLLRKHLAL
ncbi:MAG: radical SAM protein [Candidatus Nitrosocaldus sp.]